jgi:hypothetical protein
MFHRAGISAAAIAFLGSTALAQTPIVYEFQITSEAVLGPYGYQPVRVSLHNRRRRLPDVARRGALHALLRSPSRATR